MRKKNFHLHLPPSGGVNGGEGASINVALIFSLLTLFSCNASKKISYFQDAALMRDTPAPVVEDLLLRPGDKINFQVKVEGDEMLTYLFYYEMQNGGGNGSQMNYYLIDDQGNITLPMVGKVHAAGMRRYELDRQFKQGIMDLGFKSGVTVTSTLLNAEVTFIGEVNRPGRYSIDRDNINILEALALASDLTLNGRRDNVTVVRNVGGTDRVYQIDLRSLRQTMSSPAFWLQSGDIVYVEPTKKRVREAANSGNDLYTTSFWLQLTSLEIKVINLLNNLND